MTDYTDHLLLWIDVETTGLDTKRDDILEIGYILTDMEGDTLEHVSHTIIRPSMWQWKRRRLPERVRAMHEANGLLDDVDAKGMPARRAMVYDRTLIELAAKRHDAALADIHPAGSSVHFDLAMIDRLMPGMLDGLHHRVLDISSLRMAVDATGQLHAEEPDGPDRGPRTDHRVTTCLERDIDDYRHLTSGIILPGLVIDNRRTSRD